MSQRRQEETAEKLPVAQVVTSGQLAGVQFSPGAGPSEDTCKRSRGEDAHGAGTGCTGVIRDRCTGVIRDRVHVGRDRVHTEQQAGAGGMQ